MSVGDRFARLESSVRVIARRQLAPAQHDAIRNLGFALAPPIAIDAVRRLRREWETVPNGWQAERGWDSPGVVDSHRAALSTIESAITPTGPLGIPLEPKPGQASECEDANAHNLALTFGYVLARAAAGREQISVLDSGGGLGAHQLLSRALLPDVTFDYHCKEVPAVATAGRDALPEITFHAGDGCLGRTYDLVVASGSLQYERDWTALITRLSAAADRWLFLARVPVTDAEDPFVLRQRPIRYGYSTTYAGWVLPAKTLIAALARVGFSLEREFLADPDVVVPGAAGAVRSRSYLFARHSGE
jgi:putative methyltransferase (TIGR04325 family)